MNKTHQLTDQALLKQLAQTIIKHNLTHQLTQQTNSKHHWMTVSPVLPIKVFICQNCQGVKVRDCQGKDHYFYRGRIHHC